jgi:osmotically-inducible protein OsmY
MKRLTTVLLSGVLMFGAAACTNSKTAADAPGSVNESPAARAPEDVNQAKADAQSEVRRDQLNADIRAREQRNNVTGGDDIRAEGDLESQVRSKLEANIPASALVVKADDGAVTISGTVTKQDQIAKIEPLAKQIKGVKKVTVKATVAATKAQ